MVTAFSQNIEHVLPPPVFGNEPATVRVIAKNCKNIDNYHLYFIQGGIIRRNNAGSKEFQCVAKEDSIAIYELQYQPGMTYPAKIWSSLFFPSSFSGFPEIRIILVPGETSTITYDGKTEQVTFDGPYASLLREIHDNVCQGSPLFPDDSRWLNGMKQDILSEYNDITPVAYSEIMAEKVRKCTEALENNKTLSKEFREVWQYLICCVAVDMLTTYGDEYHWAHNQTQIDKVAICTPELCPFGGNAMFYVENWFAFEVLLFEYENSGIPCVFCESVRRFILATSIRNQIWRKEVKDSRLPEIKELLPEYYDFLKDVCDESPILPAVRKVVEIIRLNYQ